MPLTNQGKFYWWRNAAYTYDEAPKQSFSDGLTDDQRWAFEAGFRYGAAMFADPKPDYNSVMVTGEWALGSWEHFGR